jgi:DNA-binding LytR/AlgR family response regulator
MYVLIVDDEMPARSELRYILESLSPEATFYEATNGAEALHVVAREPVDVVFLDIHMPGQDGLEVAATIADRPGPPLIVFATAYDEHSLRAFELAALDYVVKPFNEQRLAQTMERVRRLLDQRDRLALRQEALQKYLAGAIPTGGLTKLWGERDNENWILVDYEDIMWIVAQSKKVYAHTVAGEKLRVRRTLKALESRLAERGFARVHRGYLVNLDHVAEVVPWFSRTYLVRMRDEARTEIPMSRRYAARLKKVTGWDG